MKFENLDLNHQILQAINELGYEKPSEIQEKAIPYVLQGKDVLGLAQTGTGKTAAFAMPTIQLLNNKKINGKKPVRALVLAPTRELAIQVHESFKDYAKYTKIRSAVIYGGVGQGAQVRALRQGVDVLVATPGRLLDLINQKHLSLSQVEIFILDEADRMLDMGFIHDINRVIKMLPQEKQSLLFSATMPKEVEHIVKTLQKDPVRVAVAPVSSTVDKIEQKLYYIDKRNKTALLLDLLKKQPYASFLIFVRTKRNADKLNKDLMKANIKSAAIHGDKSQNARQRALNDFKNYKLQVLVATDIAARGIDVDELDYVINYDLPEEAETYVHRIGRTGRAGMSGVALTFCSFQEKNLLKDVEKVINQKIPVEKDHSYPMEDKTAKAPKKGRGRNKKGNRKQADKKQAETKSKRPRQQKAKKQNGPYDWSNHRPKAKKKRK
ncbi:MAG TPA: DEAD/DEAH box helicase [Erysipelothrix sp.]